MKTQDWIDAVEAIYYQKELLNMAAHGYEENVYNEIMKRSFRCSLAPIEQGRIEVHLLFLRNIMIPDELPDLKQMEFSVLDISWIATQNTYTTKKNNPSKETNNETNNTDAVDIRVIAKRDPKARKNLRKWLNHARKQIQRSTQKLLQMDKRNFEHYSPTSFWEALIESAGLHHVNDKQETVIQDLFVNWQGQIINGGKHRQPLSYDLRNLCQEFSRYLQLPPLRNALLMQRIPKDEKKDCQHIGTVPWHIGWYNIYGTPVMSGVYAGNGNSPLYGSALLRNQPTVTSGLKRLLAVAPYEITVPLLCYGIFSVIKPFIPDYPARISAYEPFSKVIQEQKNMFFLSLTGKHAEELAKLFFGSFTDYVEEYSLTGKRLRKIQNRVHDGIVILNRKYKDLQTFRNGAMLRDACVVLTNAAFEESDYEIRLSSDQFHTEPAAADMQQIFQSFLVVFLNWFQKEYVYLQKKTVRKTLDIIADNAEALYCELLNANKDSTQMLPKGLKKLRTFPAGTWVELNSMIHLYSNKIRDIIEDEYDNQAIREKYKQYALMEVDDFLIKAKAFMRDQQLAADGSFANSFFNIKQIRKQHPSKKEANLHIALFVFRKFMQASPAYANEELPRPWEKYLAFNHPTDQNDVRLFFEFLSLKIVKGEIIPFRAERTANCYGWYDDKKKLIYLPYPDYYAVFENWLLEKKRFDLPSQRIFQKKMADQGLLLLADNHSKSGYGYMRPDYRIVVDSASDLKAKPRKVVKICIDLKQLTPDAKLSLQRLAKQKNSRRRVFLKQD